jgi:ribosome-associated protein
VSETFSIPEDELSWTYVRSGGPGGQNVNKVASKAVLRWHLDASPSVPEEVKARLRTLQRRRITGEGELVLSSQRFRDQDRNRQDCLEKLQEMLREASHVPKTRRPTKPHRGAKAARLRDKKHRAAVKSQRRGPSDE